MTTEQLATPLTADSPLHATFIAAGFDTPGKILALLTMAGAQMTRNAKLIALDALAAEQAAAVGVVNDKRAALQAEIAALTAQIASQAAS